MTGAACAVVLEHVAVAGKSAHRKMPACINI